MAAEKTFEGWAILELMGHRRLGGYVQEVELAGAGMLRIDVPELVDGATIHAAATQFYSPQSVYALTPTTEEIARIVRSRPAPVETWELPRKALPPASVDAIDELYDEHEQEDAALAALEHRDAGLDF